MIVESKFNKRTTLFAWFINQAYNSAIFDFPIDTS